jgi:hypothetical protein
MIGRRWSVRVIAMALGMLALAPQAARAQVVAPEFYGGDLWSRPRLTGDWGGSRGGPGPQRPSPSRSPPSRATCGPAARARAALEAVTGQLYVAVLVARLVALQIGQGQDPPS